MPMVLNIALFSIQPGVMPFRMDFLAFVKCYFALASVVCLVWMILSQWETLVMCACYALETCDNVIHTYPRTNRSKTDQVQSDKESGAENKNDVAEVGQIDGISSASDRSIWSSFGAKLLVRRSQREATARAANYC